MNRFASLSLGLTLFIALFLTSCKENTQNALILGKWNVLNDSRFSGVGMNNHQVNYAGQIGDYFDFRTDNKVYIKEGAVLDTLNYKLTSDHTISINYFAFGVDQISNLTNLTLHSVTIDTPVILTPGGQFGRKLSLRR